MPAWRRNDIGSTLMTLSMRTLRGCGVTHILTLADDRGDGKLREWYQKLGFVDASEFTSTAMVAQL